jgi:hypothetical protein
MAVDLKKLEKLVDKALKLETKESLLEFLKKMETPPQKTKLKK